MYKTQGQVFRQNACKQHRTHLAPLVAIAVVLTAGCGLPSRTVRPARQLPHDRATSVTSPQQPVIALASHEATDTPATSTVTSDDASENAIPGDHPDDAFLSDQSPRDLEIAAVAANPSLRRLAQEYQAARAKVRYIDKLPDPTIGTNIFGHPIETAAGAQRANLAVSQMLPWLPRLDAQARQACLEAAAMGQVYAAERLRVVADIRALWYRLYVVAKQIEINSANQELLESLIDVANARVATGKASQGDVLLGTLEYSKLEETLVTLRQQLAATKAEINRLVGRDAETPIATPQQLTASLPDWSHPMLRDLAWSHQPEIESARIGSQATRWGIEVARTKRRPDFSVNAAWFAIDDNRPFSAIVDVGKDAWSVGAMMSVPLWQEKYDAMEQEARWKHAASYSSVEQAMQRYDSMLLELWEQAQAADETARLYRDTIIPESQRTLTTDQLSYSNGEVEFDRVVQDFRNLLTLEIGYHRSIGQLATTIARIQQATGTELSEGGKVHE